MKNKLLILATILVLSLAFTACGSDGGTKKDKEPAKEAQKEEEPAYEVQTIDVSGVEIELYNHEIVTDSDDQKVLVMSFNVTNNNDYEAGFGSRQMKSTQNGEDLKGGPFSSLEMYEKYAEGVEDVVDPGESHNLVLVRVLIDETSPVELEFFGYTSTVEHVNMTIELE